jgi:hypothetical protein
VRARSAPHRDTSDCSAVMTAAAATMGSTFRCGIAAWPPRPVTVTSNDSAPAMMVPARVATWPEGMCGITCMPNTASAPAMAPSRTITSAPAPPSSAG